VGSRGQPPYLPLAVLNPGESPALLDPYYLPLAVCSSLRPFPCGFARCRAKARLAADFGVFATASGSTEADGAGVHNPPPGGLPDGWMRRRTGLRAKHRLLAHDHPTGLARRVKCSAVTKTHWRGAGIEFFSFSESWAWCGFRCPRDRSSPADPGLWRQVKGVIDFNHRWPAGKAPICRPCAGPRVARSAQGGVPATAGTHGWPWKRGWPVKKLRMALYLWLACHRRRGGRAWDLEAFCAAYSKHTGVALTPGNGFGPAGEAGSGLAAGSHPEGALAAGASRSGRWLQPLFA